MKKAILSVALASLAFACKSQTTEVTDTSAPAAAECKTECALTCEEKKAECATKSECKEQKVCPVTGKVTN